MDLSKIQKLKEILEEIKLKGVLNGVLLSDREGTLILDNLSIDFDKSLCSSMCATVFESATEVGRKSGEQKLVKIITEIGDQSVIILGCDEKRFLTLFANFESKLNVLFDEIQDEIKKIVLLYEYD
ncbi:MAG: hypothetical protein EU533_07240 [Promethearchaeota archaeon]|nr:MAG: hypothetical protein EU533_07240 [Candidatus Lokiarchaeota archaeon]